MASYDFSYMDRARTSKQGPFFVDQHDRHLLLHGLNVSGSCKLPITADVNDLDPADDNFWRQSTFVGRPFPLETAMKHFTRLQSYGITLIRFVLTWEAIEPQQNMYDDDYLKYLRIILNMASSCGLLIILDCHQDCWSRFTGGSGAPLWTMDVVGLDPRNFETCGAALLHAPSYSGHGKAGTLWATNYTKFAVNTMFTLFFAGDTFASESHIEGESIGTFLRRHYIAAFVRVLKELYDIPGIIGLDLMNEPHYGFIGMASLHKFDENVLLHLESIPTALQSMKLAAGISQEVPYYTKSWPRPTTQTSTVVLNKGGVRAWKRGARDIWRHHGVWTTSECKDDYFAHFPEHHARAREKVDFCRDFYQPFLREFHFAIQGVAPKLYTIIEPVPNTMSNPLEGLQSVSQVCFAPHWYDLKVLFEKKFNSWLTMNVQALSRGSRNILAHTYLGHEQAIKNYSTQYASTFTNSPSSVPRIVGETGVPYDMNSHYSQSTSRGLSHDYRDQTEMMDIMCTAMERNLLSYTIWNYTPENRAYNGGGDLWNDEDFSVFCESEITRCSDMADQYAGSRAAQAWIRPTAIKIAGYPLRSEFSRQKAMYVLDYKPSTATEEISRTTEIFIPNIHLRGPIRVQCTGRQMTWRYDAPEQSLYVVHELEAVHTDKDGRVVVYLIDEHDSTLFKSFWLQYILLIIFIIILTLVIR